MLREGVARAGRTLTGGLLLLAALVAALVAPHREPAPATPGHEPGDASTRGVMAVAGLLLAGLAVAVVFVSWLEVQFTGYGVTLAPPGGVSNAPAALPRQEAPPERGRPLPLTGAPANDLAELRAAESRTLHTYGWVDRDANVVRIPIDRAIAVLAERGLPSAPAAPREPAVGASASGRFVEPRAP
jgi:hypothetical protein